MIDVAFAIILGFAITSILYGVLEDWYDDRMVARFAILLVVFGTVIVLGKDEVHDIFLTAQSMIVSSVMVHMVWFLAGATVALITQLIAKRDIL